MKQRSAEVDTHVLHQLHALLDLLTQWNDRINLVAAGTREEHWHRHIEDSLQLGPLLPAGDGPVADIGSGAGFPGMVLAITSGRPTHLIEADRRKAAFLVETVARLSLRNVQVHACRAEDLALSPVPVVTARAFAPLIRLLPLANQLLGSGGTALLPKGQSAEQELSAVAGIWHADVERFPSSTDKRATILRLSNLRRADAG